MSSFNLSIPAGGPNFSTLTQTSQSNSPTSIVETQRQTIKIKIDEVNPPASWNTNGIYIYLKNIVAKNPDISELTINLDHENGETISHLKFPHTLTKKLKALTIDSPALTKISFDSALTGHFKFIKELDLGGCCELSSKYLSCFRGTHLSYLGIGSCSNIKTLMCLGKTPNLVNLHIYSTALTSLRSLGPLSHLEKMIADQSCLSTMDGIGPTPNLKELEVEYLQDQGEKELDLSPLGPLRLERLSTTNSNVKLGPNQYIIDTEGEENPQKRGPIPGLKV